MFSASVNSIAKCPPCFRTTHYLAKIVSQSHLPAQSHNPGRRTRYPFSFHPLPVLYWLLTSRPVWNPISRWTAIVGKAMADKYFVCLQSHPITFSRRHWIHFARVKIMELQVCPWRWPLQQYESINPIKPAEKSNPQKPFGSMFQFDPAVRPALRISAEPSALMTHCECILTWAVQHHPLHWSNWPRTCNVPWQLQWLSNANSDAFPTNSFAIKEGVHHNQKRGIQINAWAQILLY